MIKAQSSVFLKSMVILTSCLSLLLPFPGLAAKKKAPPTAKCQKMRTQYISYKVRVATLLAQLQNMPPSKQKKVRTEIKSKNNTLKKITKDYNKLQCLTWTGLSLEPIPPQAEVVSNQPVDQGSNSVTPTTPAANPEVIPPPVNSTPGVILPPVPQPVTPPPTPPVNAEQVLANTKATYDFSVILVLDITDNVPPRQGQLYCTSPQLSKVTYLPLLPSGVNPPEVNISCGPPIFLDETHIQNFLNVMATSHTSTTEETTSPASSRISTKRLPFKGSSGSANKTQCTVVFPPAGSGFTTNFQCN